MKDRPFKPSLSIISVLHPFSTSLMP